MDCVSSSHVTLATRLNATNLCGHGSGIGQLPRIHVLNVLINGTRIYERVMVYNRNTVGHVLVYVSNIRDVIDGVIVVDVCDLHHAYVGVSHVYILNIARTGVIPRNINFARPKREPSYRSRANTNSDAKSCAADERN